MVVRVCALLRSGGGGGGGGAEQLRPKQKEREATCEEKSADTVSNIAFFPTL